MNWKKRLTDLLGHKQVQLPVLPPSGLDTCVESPVHSPAKRIIGIKHLKSPLQYEFGIITVVRKC
ncbi:MAG: hypothetical protein AAF824_05970 [Bacteroidota bacterium]